MSSFQKRVLRKLEAVPGFIGADAPMGEGCLCYVTIEPNCVDAALAYLSRRFHVGELDVSAGVGLVVELVPRSRKTPSRKMALAKAKPVQYVFEFETDRNEVA